MYIVIAAALISGAVIYYRKRLSRERLWNRISVELATKFKLEYDSFAEYPDAQLTGKYNGYDVSLSLDADKNTCTADLILSFSSPLPEDVKISKTGFMDSLLLAKGYRRLITGDADFDSMFITDEKSAAFAAALMNADMRMQFSYLSKICEEIFLGSSGIRLKFVSGITYLTREVKKILDILDAIAREACCMNDIKSRLEAIARNETRQTVKISSIFSLMLNYSETRRDGELLDEITVLKGEDLFFRTDVSGLPSELKSMAFGIAGLSGLSGFNSYLLRELENSEDDSIDGILAALALTGTVKTVEPLLKICSLKLSVFYRSRCSETVAAIQSRLGNAEKGWVSINEAGELDGALSESDGSEDGALSFGKDREG